MKMAENGGSGEYKLRCVLQGHSMDEKSVHSCSQPQALLTSSRDKTAKYTVIDPQTTLNAEYSELNLIIVVQCCL